MGGSPLKQGTPMKTTLRKWMNEIKEPIQSFYISPTPINNYSYSSGLKSWGEDLPSGLFKGNEIPPEILDNPFDSGYGSPAVPDVLIWTKYSVYYVRVFYDGSTRLRSVPRNPPDRE